MAITLSKISVEEISFSELARHRDFILKAKYKNFSQFREIPEQMLAELFLQEISEIKPSSEPCLFMAKAGGRPAGFLCLHRLEWDSDHFGIPMGKVKRLLGEIDPASDLEVKKSLIQAALEQMKKMGIRHLAARVSADDARAVAAMENAGFYLADTIVEYYFDFRKTRIPEMTHQCQMRLFQPADLEMVNNGVRGIFDAYLDRFHRDPHLDKRKSDQLYEKWMINSCRGLSDDCLIAVVDGKLAGLSTLETYGEINRHLPMSFGEIILSGVVEAFRGKKIYTSMINFGQEYFKGKVDLLRVATQLNNIYVQRAWAGLGFLLKYAFHTYHYYMPGG